MASPDPQAAPHGRATHDEAVPPLVLVVDDEPLLLRSLRRILERGGYRIALAESAKEAESMLSEPDLGVVLANVSLGGKSGIEMLERVKQSRADVEVIMMTDDESAESAVGCIRRGAFDCVAKPFGGVDRIRNTVGKALEHSALIQRNRELETELRERTESALPTARGHGDVGADLPVSLAAYERSALERALWECGGDASAAAARLGIGRSTLYRKLARHNLSPSREGGTGCKGGGGRPNSMG